MDTRWLYYFLRACVRDFSDAGADETLQRFRADNPDLGPKEFIRRYLDHRLRERGVVYGTPLASEETITGHTRKGYPQRWAVFMALQQVQAVLAMEIGCAISHRPEGDLRVGELMVCYALFCRNFRLAAKLHGLLPRLAREGEPPAAFVRLTRKVARELPERAYLAGNPLLGLPMHNSFNYGDAKTFCRIAVVYFELGRPDRAQIQRVLDFHDRERKLLLQALVGLTLADRKIGVSSRRVMIGQIRSANLPRPARRELLAMLGQPVSTLAVAAAVSDDRTRDFLLEQVLLGAVLDGHLSEREWDYIEDLAGWLGVSHEDLAMVEARVVSFYEQHRAYLDMFTVGTAVRSYRQRMLDRLQKAIGENLGLIVDEIKSKGDLGELLFRASTGEKLSAGEWKQVRGQLLDIIRSVPSLAIFTLPGGAVLLPLIYKVLPDGLKPRVFAERDKQRRREGGPEII